MPLPYTEILVQDIRGLNQSVRKIFIYGISGYGISESFIATPFPFVPGKNLHGVFSGFIGFQQGLPFFYRNLHFGAFQ